MIQRNLQYILWSFFLLVSCQPASSRGFVQRDTLHPADLTIAYAISVSSPGKAGVGETYNGGIKTIFVSGDKARMRQASLARVQSIFLLPQKNGAARIVIAKESGTEKYRVNMTAAQWREYNSKYDSARFTLYDDSLVIAGFNCRKGAVTLQDGRQIEVWFTNEVDNQLFRRADPAFTSVPGIVLQYAYHIKRSSIIYTATEVAQLPVDKKVFAVPVTGYQLKRYIPGRPAEPVSDLLQEEEWEDGDDAVTDSLQKQQDKKH